jgi:hypothetical protein
MGEDFATSVLRASLFWASDSVGAHGLDSQEHQINYYDAESPGNSTLSQEHVEISGRALPEMVGMLFKERTCGLPPLGTEHP